jgi:hypothetical protein
MQNDETTPNMLDMMKINCSNKKQQKETEFLKVTQNNNKSEFNILNIIGSDLLPFRSPI